METRRHPRPSGSIEETLSAKEGQSVRFYAFQPDPTPRMLDRPICIIGAARSGTTVLGHLLAHHPAVAYWEEPKYVWRYRKPTAPHDVRTAAEATPAVRHYIRSELSQHVVEHDADRLLEKTPSNCFRVPFVYAVLPNIRIVHLVRDGRDVAFSARQQWLRLNDGKADPTEATGASVDGYDRIWQPVWERLQALEVPLVDLPFYAAQYLQKLTMTAFGKERPYVWGPKFPDIREVAEAQNVLEVCAVQWAKSVQAARNGLRSVPDDQQLEVRFETLVQAPTTTLRRILDFAKISMDPTLIERAEETLRADAAHRWKKRDEDEIKRIMNEVGRFVKKIDSEYR